MQNVNGGDGSRGLALAARVREREFSYGARVAGSTKFDATEGPQRAGDNGGL